MNEPKLGTTRPISPCGVCGGAQNEVYVSWPIYHNDVERGWKQRRHSNLQTCITALAKRVLELESKKS